MVISIIDFSPLWETLKEKNITQYQLIQQGINNGLLDRLRKNENITLKNLEKICKACECTPEKVVRFTDDE